MEVAAVVVAVAFATAAVVSTAAGVLMSTSD